MLRGALIRLPANIAQRRPVFKQKVVWASWGKVNDLQAFTKRKHFRRRVTPQPILNRIPVVGFAKIPNGARGTLHIEQYSPKGGTTNTKSQPQGDIMSAVLAHRIMLAD